jgi:hypothetical protein
MAGEATALAKPVIGKSVPPPASFAILSNTPTAVSTTAISTSRIELHAPATSRGRRHSHPKSWITPSANRQIPPPIKKAYTQFFTSGERGALACT